MKRERELLILGRITRTDNKGTGIIIDLAVKKTYIVKDFEY